MNSWLWIHTWFHHHEFTCMNSKMNSESHIWILTYDFTIFFMIMNSYLNSYKISWSWIHMLHFMTYELIYEFMYMKNIVKSYLKLCVPKVSRWYLEALKMIQDSDLSKLESQKKNKSLFSDLQGLLAPLSLRTCCPGACPSEEQQVVTVTCKGVISSISPAIPMCFLLLCFDSIDSKSLFKWYDGDGPCSALNLEDLELEDGSVSQCQACWNVFLSVGLRFVEM